MQCSIKHVSVLDLCWLKDNFYQYNLSVRRAGKILRTLRAFITDITGLSLRILLTLDQVKTEEKKENLAQYIMDIKTYCRNYDYRILRNITVRNISPALLSVCLSVCLPACLPVCLSNFPSICTNFACIYSHLCYFGSFPTSAYIPLVGTSRNEIVFFFR